MNVAPLSQGEMAEIRAEIITRVQARCIIHSGPERRLVDSRGRQQNWLFDLRPLIMDGETASLFARMFWELMEPFRPFQIASQELAGVPMMGAVLAYGAMTGRPTTGVIVRRERKTHGRQRRLEGELSELPVVLLDDIVNSGGSAERAVDALREEGAQVTALFTVVDFQADALKARLASLNMVSRSLFRLDEFGIAFPVAAPRRMDAPLDVVWRFRPRRASYMHVARKAAPVISGGMALHASEDGWLHALRLESGEVAWTFQAGRRPGKGVWSTPLVSQGAVYVGSYDGAVFKLDLRTGELLWRFDGADWVGSSPATGVHGRSVFVGLEHAQDGGTGGVARLDAQSGALVWEHRVPAQVHATPLVLPRGAVVCGANDGRIRLLDPETGRAIWTTSVGADVKAAPALSADGGRIYVGSCDGGVYALELRGGAVAWRAATDGPVFGAPLVLGLSEVAAASADGTVRVFDAGDGGELRQVRLGGKLFAGLVRLGGELVIGSTDGRLTRLKASDLSIASQHQFPERLTSEVAQTADGLLLVPTYDGQLFAVREPVPPAAGGD